jgi:hypothetical protein
MISTTRDPIHHRNLKEIFLDALPKDYDPVVASIASKSIVVSVYELESFPRLDKNKKQLLTDAAPVNFTQIPSPQASS